MGGSGGWKPTVDFNLFDNYAIHTLRTQNTESGEPETKNIGEKYQDNNEFIIHNDLINEIWNLITDII